MTSRPRRTPASWRPGRSGGADPVAAGGSLSRSRLGRIADLFFEAGMLRRTPRSGWPFLGRGKENVAEHSFRAAAMAFVLAKLAGADPWRACAMALFHDLHEARTADLNYVHQRYAGTDERRALADALEGTGLEAELLGLFDEFEARESPEAKLARDADQLDLAFNLKAELDRGLDFAGEWLASALRRLRTDEARRVAEAMLRVDHNRWWYGRVDRRWWVDRDARYRLDCPSGQAAGWLRGRGAEAAGAPSARARNSARAGAAAGMSGRARHAGKDRTAGPPRRPERRR